MKTKLILSVATLAMGMTFTACNKNSNSVTPDSSTTGSSTNMSYGLKASNTSSGLGQKGTANAMLTWTSGFANPTMIKFEAKQKGTQIEYKSTNTSQIDLFAPVATSFGGFTIPAGTYKEIELKLALDNVGTQPALQLNGTFTNNLTNIPVILRIDDDFEIKTEVKDVTIDENSDFMAITTLDLANMQSSITQSMLQNATLTNGTIIISRTSNRSLYNMLLSSISGKRHHWEYEHHHH